MGACHPAERVEETSVPPSKQRAFMEEVSSLHTEPFQHVLGVKGQQRVRKMFKHAQCSSRWQYGVPPFTSRHPGRPLRYNHILYLENVNTYQICCVEQLLDSPDSFSTMLMSLSVLRSFMHCHSFEFHLFRCEFAAMGIFYSPSPPVAVIAVCGNCKPVLITCINICSVKHLMYNLCNVSGCPTLVCVCMCMCGRDPLASNSKRWWCGFFK